MNKFATAILVVIIIFILFIRIVESNMPTVHETILVTNENVINSENNQIKPEFTIDDFNKLDKDSLMEFPGIGEVTAQNVIDYIEIHGPFKSFDELINVKGIGIKKLEKILSNLP